MLSLFIGELQGKAGVHPNHYEVGTIQRLPWPSLAADSQVSLEAAARGAVESLTRFNELDEVSRHFVSPVLDKAAGFKANLRLVATLEASVVHEVARHRSVADGVVAQEYGFSAEDLSELAEAFDDRVPPASGRWRIYFGEDGQDLDAEAYAQRVASWLFGVAIDRWNPVPEQSALPKWDPVAEPTRGSRVERASTELQPLVDDPGHPQDVIRSIQQSVSTAGWTGESTSQLADVWLTLKCGRGGARKYFKKKFFSDHVKRYSKSRRKAPIYWQLSTASSKYSVWLCFQALEGDTLYRVLRDYVDPKIEHEDARLRELTRDLGPMPPKALREQLGEQTALVDELNAFRAELRRVVRLWNPNLNDGVIINFAPLWRLVPQHKAWQKQCKTVWVALCQGEYDWSHLAMHLWPERVVPKCQDDRSLAIAHGLEEEFWYEGGDGKKAAWEKRQVGADRVAELVVERSSSAAKAALEDLLSAPAPTGGRSTRGGKSRRRGATA